MILNEIVKYLLVYGVKICLHLFLSTIVLYSVINRTFNNDIGKIIVIKIKIIRDLGRLIPWVPPSIFIFYDSFQSLH